MALNLFKKAVNVSTGIDISPENIIVCTLSHEKGKYSLVNLIKKPFGEEIIRDGQIYNPDSLTECLKTIIEENNLETGKVNISVSSNNLFIKTVTFPDMSIEELRIIAPQEASKHVSFSVNEMNVDFQILENSGKENKIDVILCALSKAVARDLVESISKAGVEVSSIDVSAFAALRTFANAQTVNVPAKVYASVLIGYENTDISIVKDGMPVFSHIMQSGKKNVLESIMKGFEINREEAGKRLPDFALIVPGAEPSMNPDVNKASNLTRGIYSSIASELQKTIEFYNSRTSESIEIEKVILGGCGICIGNIDKYIANKLRIDTEVCDSLKNISHNLDNIENINIPALSTSIGLALKGFAS